MSDLSHLDSSGRVRMVDVSSKEESARVAVAQTAHNGTAVECEDPRFAGGGATRYLRHPVRYERTPASLRRHAPRLGEHAEQVLAEAGYAPEEIAALRGCGALG